jgi:hypothetical protein
MVVVTTLLMLQVQFSYSVVEGATLNLVCAWLTDGLFCCSDEYRLLQFPNDCFSSLCMIFALIHCILWSSSHDCSAILDLKISPVYALRLCSVILVTLILSLFIFLPTVAWDAVYAILCFLYLIFGFSRRWCYGNPFCF